MNGTLGIRDRQIARHLPDSSAVNFISPFVREPEVLYGVINFTLYILFN
jgi:hypothetical protein